MDKINNWIARKGNVIGLLLFVFGYTALIFLMGALWQLEQDLKEVQKVKITTQIIEYRLGNVVLGRDTMNVIKEQPITKWK